MLASPVCTHQYRICGIPTQDTGPCLDLVLDQEYGIPGVSYALQVRLLYSMLVYYLGAITNETAAAPLLAQEATVDGPMEFMIS